MKTNLSLRKQAASPAEIIDATHIWLERAVIDLNLCPFAKAVYIKQQIRYIVSKADDIDGLLAELDQELALLQKTDPARTDTTLLILPSLLHNFLDYNDFLNLADLQIDVAGLRGELQIASFHPDYRFAGADPDAIENFTNRSPYPILHLLREASIDRAIAAFPKAESIFERNIETLRTLGHAGWNKLMQAPPQVN